MSELEKKVSAVRRRLKLFRVLDWCFWALIAGLATAALFLLATKFFDHQMPAFEVGGGIVGAALTVAIIASLFTRLSVLDAAVAADRKLNLRERLSSALLLSRSPLKEAPAYAALEDDAQRHARAIHPGRDFRYRIPPHAKHTLWPAIAIVAIYFMPQMDLFNKPATTARGPMYTPPEMTDEQRGERVERLRELAEKARVQEEGLEEADEDLQLAEKLERLSRDLSLGKKSDREVVAEMSRLSDEIRMREREIAKKTQPYKQLKGLERSEYTQDLKKDLKDQDFEAAAEKLMDLAEMMQDPSQMTPEQMQQMAKELDDLAKSLEESPEMAKALEQASRAMQQAAQQQPQQQQQQASSQQDQASQGGQQERNQSGQNDQQNQQQQQQQANQQGSQSASQGEQGQSKQQQQAAQNAAASLQQAASQMQDMQQMMQQAQALSEMQSSMSSAMSQSLAQSASQSSSNKEQGSSNPNTSPGTCSSCSGAGCGTCNGTGKSNTGKFSRGDNVRQGMGTGGPGRGRGGNPPDDGSMASDFEDVFIPGQQNEGEIIATFEIEASAPRGESTLRYTSVPQAYKQRAADAIVDQEIPAAMRNSVRDYFEKINFQEQ